MQLTSFLIVVADMARSRRFYHDVLGLDAIHDFGANVLLEGGLSLQTAASWQGFTGISARMDGGDAEIYFETDDLDGFMAMLEARDDIRLVHPIKEHGWGQRAIRFYDPDRHIIEVGDGLAAVARRFAQGGMDICAVAKRMDITEDYARSLLRE